MLVPVSWTLVSVLAERKLAYTWTGSPVDYKVQTGDAVFLVAGESDDEHVTLVVTNTTDITASESSGEWAVDSFEIKYIDDSSNTWTVHVAESTWLE